MLSFEGLVHRRKQNISGGWYATVGTVISQGMYVYSNLPDRTTIIFQPMPTARLR